MEISNEIKAKIFAQYFGAKCEHRVFTIERVWEDRGEFNMDCDLIELCMDDTEDYKTTLLLKPLSSITDEDAIEVAKFCHISSHKDNHVLKHEGKDLIENYLYRQSNVNGINWLRVFDYLRSKGYALPYLNYSIEDLVEAGIYKLTQ